MMVSAGVVLVAAGLARPSRWLIGAVLVLTFGLMAGLLALSGAYADLMAPTQSPLARTSLGSAFWVLTLALWLGLMDALHQLQAGLSIRTLVWAAMLLVLIWLLASGGCDQLSIMKEFANQSDTYVGSILRHLQIILFTMVPAVGLGLPLGWAVNRSLRLQQWLLPSLNIIQTIPSIALFGLLMVPLAWLAGRWPLLASWGVSGIGLAPAVVALTLYSLLPVVRSTQAGLAQVSAAVREAGLGMGMSPWRIFWRAELPLAAPVILAGVRTATIQTVGLAAVAALIGAGGLGAIMFDGLFGSAQDLVLLGVLPIMGLAVLLDVGFKVLARLVLPGLEGTAT
jgi:osmoprotectant transport system permease protein